MNMRVSAFPEDVIVEEPEEIVMSTSRFSVDSVMQSVRNFATLSEALRILRACKMSKLYCETIMMSIIFESRHHRNEK